MRLKNSTSVSSTSVSSARVNFAALSFAALSFAALGLTACSGANAPSADTLSASSAASTPVSDAIAPVATANLDEILAAQSDKAKARYTYRNPKETLEFFGIKPGMSVAEVLPGGGWYSKILLPHLGDQGHLIGVDYALDMWPEFGGFADAAFIEKKTTWPQEWTGKAQAWRAGSQAKISAYPFGAIDSELNGTVDAVLFIRAMHNLSRFDAAGGYMRAALKDSYDLLKPGGIVGIVQHQAPESNSDEATLGANGYLKRSALIAQMKAAGFELIKSSDINANPKDVPSNDDIVWRLLPNLRTSEANTELRAELEAIGESNRMTLLFKKL